MDVSLNVNGEHQMILIYGLNGETLSGEEVELFSNMEDYEINSIIVVNVLGDAMEIEMMDKDLPKTFSLNQNYPNPFNPSTKIGFTLGKNELISLNIYDVQGRLIKTLIDNEQFSDGYHQFLWNGKNNFEEQVPSGMYLYKLKGDHQLEMKKMILIGRILYQILKNME